MINKNRINFFRMPEKSSTQKRNSNFYKRGVRFLSIQDQISKLRWYSIRETAHDASLRINSSSERDFKILNLKIIKKRSLIIKKRCLI